MKQKKTKLQKRKEDPNSTYYRDKCDELVRKIVMIRDDGKCIICGDKHLPNNHHLIDKTNYPTRWEIDNLVLLCPSHHKFLKTMSAHMAGIVFAEWMRNNRPEQYWWVLDNINKKLSITYKEVAEELKKMFAEMDSYDR